MVQRLVPERRVRARLTVGVGLQHHHGARTALALGAPFLGAGESAATQPVEQGDLPTDLAEGTELTVDTHAGHRHHAPIHDTPKHPSGCRPPPWRTGAWFERPGRDPNPSVIHANDGWSVGGTLIEDCCER